MKIGTLSNDNDNDNDDAVNDNEQDDFAFTRSFPIIPTRTA